MLKRLAFVMLLVLFTLTIGGSLAAAQSQRFPQLETLTAYFPTNTLVYGAVRSDPAYIETLSGLYDYVVARLPQDVIGSDVPPTLAEVLNQTFAGFDGDFDTTVSPWLGESIALGVLPYRNSIEMRLVIAITDQAAALKTLTRPLARDGWVEQQQPGYTRFVKDNDYDDSSIVVFPNVIIISSEQLTSLETAGVESPNLSSSPYYSDAIALLPAASYNLLAYVDTPMVLATSVGSDWSRSQGERLLMAALIRMVGPTAAGGTLTGEKTLTLDVAQRFGNRAGLDALGIQLPGTGQTLDTNFLANVPSDAVLVAHGANLNNGYEFVRNNLGEIVNIIGLLPEGSVEGGQTIAGINRLFEVVFANVTGLNYEQDVQSWVSSDFALFVEANPDFNPNTPNAMWPVELGAVFRVSDPASAAGFVTKLERELPITLRALDERNTVTVERVEVAAGATAISVTAYEYRFDSDPRIVADSLIGANDSVVVMGTRDAATSILNGEAGGFQAVLPEPLPNTGLALYVNSTPLIAALERWSQLRPGLMNQNDMQQLLVLTNLLEGATISAAGTPNSDLVARLTLTLR
ncbi:MAG: DUF3352 domain-containing protein [Anaerolineae bacterium]|nr:DUF3352 domain-containing protein [Anaerolineae bacterium]